MATATPVHRHAGVRTGRDAARRRELRIDRLTDTAAPLFQSRCGHLIIQVSVQMGLNTPKCVITTQSALMFARKASRSTYTPLLAGAIAVGTSITSA